MVAQCVKALLAAYLSGVPPLSAAATAIYWWVDVPLGTFSQTESTILFLILALTVTTVGALVMTRTAMGSGIVLQYQEMAVTNEGIVLSLLDGRTTTITLSEVKDFRARFVLGGAPPRFFYESMDPRDMDGRRRLMVPLTIGLAHKMSDVCRASQVRQ